MIASTEKTIPGVSQSQVNAPAGFDLHTGLRSLLRQDPEVIMIGEIRDRLTAEIAIQACWERAAELVRDGATSPSEVRRVLGVSMRI